MNTERLMHFVRIGWWVLMLACTVALLLVIPALAIGEWRGVNLISGAVCAMAFNFTWTNLTQELRQ